jgi:hypothetical protein
MLNALILLFGIIILVASLGLGILLPIARTAAAVAPRGPRVVSPDGTATAVRKRHVAGGILGSAAW